MSNPIVAQTNAALPIRRAAAGDAPDCAQIIYDWLASTSWLTTPPSADMIAQSLASGIETYEVWVAGSETPGDPVAGYLSFGPDAALIRGFYVNSPGAGTGKALLDHIKQGKSTLQLWTHAPNTRAHDFYLREGFTFSGKSRAGTDGPEELHMLWQRPQAPE
jgi:GNAT superfamily N-acetyltransferase